MIKQTVGKHITNFLSEKTNKLVYTVNQKLKTVRYILQTDQRSEKPYKEILFAGFDKLPSGFYTDGFGITTGGWLFDKFLKDKFGDSIQIVNFQR